MALPQIFSLLFFRRAMRALILSRSQKWCCSVVVQSSEGFSGLPLFLCMVRSCWARLELKGCPCCINLPIWHCPVITDIFFWERKIPASCSGLLITLNYWLRVCEPETSWNYFFRNAYVVWEQYLWKWREQDNKHCLITLTFAKGRFPSGDEAGASSPFTSLPLCLSGL